MQSLALKYRPRTFDDLVGQRPVQVVLRRMVETRKVPQALLFDGMRGTGKTTTARILAAALNCEGSPVPCGACVSCKSVYDGTSLDVIEMDGASNGLVEDIRHLREQVMYEVGGNYRVVLIDEAHGCSTPAFNAMLKTFEEPPLNTVFVLLTTEPGRIPDTVQSRLMPFTFHRIGTADIMARLQYIADCESIDADSALLQAIADAADGGLRDAIMRFDQLARVGVTTLAGYTDLTGDSDYGPALLGHLAAGDIAAAYDSAHQQLQRTGNPAVIADRLTDTLRDVLVLAAGGTLTSQGEPLAARTRLAGTIDKITAVAGLRVLWDLKTRMRATDDPRIGLDLALAMLADTLHKPATRAASSPPPAAAAAPLNLAQMAAAARR